MFSYLNLELLLFRIIAQDKNEISLKECPDHRDCQSQMFECLVRFSLC